ncbi:MAG: Tic22 family protein [Cyanobacteria bacterium J06642_2]
MKLARPLSLALVACTGIWFASQAVLAAPVERHAPTILAQAETDTAASGLSRQEVTERLDAVPVFAIVSEDGTPILATVENEGEKVQIASFWLDPNEAVKTIDQIKTRTPDIGSQARIVPLSLGYAFTVAEEQKENEGDLVFQVLPKASVVTEALDMVNQESAEEELKEFPGVPLFYGESEEGVLTVESNGNEVVPFFFERADLKAALDRASSESPEVTQKTTIEVTTLEQVVNSMLAPDAENNVSKIAFVPSRSALESVQTFSEDAPAEAPSAE